MGPLAARDAGDEPYPVGKSGPNGLHWSQARFSPDLWMIILLGFALFALLVLLPLVPAVITYRISPDRPVVAQGRFDWLTFKTGGAFAAYLVTLVFSNLLGSDIMAMIRAEHSVRLSSPKRVVLDVQLLDAEGNPLAVSLHDLQPIVRLDPEFYRAGTNTISVEVPGEPAEWGYMVEVPNYGSGYVAHHELALDPDPNTPGGLRLRTPIVVRPSRQ